MRCRWSAAKSSRLEHAKAPPSDVDIRAWCSACGRPGRADDLIAASRQADELYAEWRRLNRSGMLRKQEDILARVQRVYCSNVIPGFMQTPAYATALLTAITRFQGTPDDVEAAVRSRGRRARASSRRPERWIARRSTALVLGRTRATATTQRGAVPGVASR